jgi:HAE1 family hydrophobic/amphiphilic exporter-1
MHPIEAAVRHPVKVTVGFLLVALFGLVALFDMPMQLTPEVQTPTISIRTRWRGASPKEIEREIVLAQEEQLKGVENARKLSSECRDSEGQVEIEFAVGTNIEAAMVRVSRRLQQVREYPEDADEPVITTSSTSSRAIAWFILCPRPPDEQRIREFQQRFPHLSVDLERVIQSPAIGLSLLRLRHLAAANPELNELLPADVDLPKQRRFVEDYIEARFERVKGVSDATVMGGREDEVQVVVDPQRLSARQISVDDLREALRRQNADTSGGDFWEGKRRYVVRTLGQFRSLDQVADLIIAVRDGIPVYVRDVANVRMGFKKPDGIVRRYGQSSITVNAERETGANVLEVMNGLRNACAELNDGVLKQNDLYISQTYDETDYIYSAIGLVGENIVVGGLLTVAVLLLFLRSGRSTLIIALAIPSSIVGTFLMLSLLGRSLNVISLAGLAFAVGMLVDNAVVVLENIFRRHQQGEAPFIAAVAGTKEVWGAVVASTLTTLAVFVPVLFVQQEAGQLFRDIALAISFAVGLSLIVSVTLIPTAAARLLRRTDKNSQQGWGREQHERQPNQHQHQHHNQRERQSRKRPGNAILRRVRNLHAPLDWAGETFVEGVVRVNRWIQASTGRCVVVVTTIVSLCFILTWLTWPSVEYLPTGNRNLAIGIIMPPPGYNLDQMIELGNAVEEHLRPCWDYDPLQLETTADKYPPVADFFFIARGRNIFIGLRALKPTDVRTLVAVLREMSGALPGSVVVANQSSLFERGLGAGRSIEIEIAGDDLDRLVDIGRVAMNQISRVMPEAQCRPEPSLDQASPEVHIVPKPLQTAELGVDNRQLGYVVDMLVDGAYATDYYLGGDKIDLTIMGDNTRDEVAESFRGLTQDLDVLPIATPAGQLVTLADLADIRLSSGPEQINHRERDRAITITVSPPEGMALEETIRVLQTSVLPALDLSGGYRINLSGSADKLRATWDALRWNLALAVLITYLLMAALFESWLYPLAIIFAVPLSAVGGILGLRMLSIYLAWLGEPPQMLDVLTMLGFVILVGTVVNNAILIVHQSLNHIRVDKMPAQEATIESVRTRIRPIFMTTGSTVFGLAPLVFFPGAGSELYRGLGSVVLGGLVLSALFTLVVVPALFSAMMTAKYELSRRLYTDAAADPVPVERAHSPTRRPRSLLDEAQRPA